MNSAKTLWYDKDHSMGRMDVNGVKCPMGSEMVEGRRKDSTLSCWISVRVFHVGNPSGTFYISAATLPALENKVSRYQRRLVSDPLAGTASRKKRQRWDGASVANWDARSNCYCF